MRIRFTLPGAPRTKKTSNRIVRAGKFAKVMPSKAYCDYERALRPVLGAVCAQLADGGVRTPITGPVEVAATFYRDADRGDLCGYMQALGDILQCSVIVDDIQISSWDGTRLAKDAARPRVEVEMTVLQGALI
jgi:Holliday junction resolvase RusA-like endonuclease